MRVLVEVPTKDRDAILGRYAASLLKQSFQDFDVVFVNDGSEPIGKVQTTSYLLEHLRNDRQVWILDGSHISQAHNHNMVLYGKEFRDYRYIVRCDDDLLANKFALQYMYDDIRLTGAGAVGGLWMEEEYLSEELHDRKIFYSEEDFKKNLSINPRVGPINSNWQQRVYHPTDQLMEVQHVYSMCIFDAEAMRQAGGWPEVYGKGVAHGEETDGTYRLHLSGYKLFIDPRVTGTHLRAPGGIRSVKNLSQVQSVDLMKWQNRLPLFGGINFEPTVAVECRHCYGLGGAERLFYHTVHLLQSRFGVVHPVFPSSLYLSPDECEHAFGFGYEEPDEYLDEYDVLIVIGHEPQHITKAHKKIHYCLFPITTDRKELRELDCIMGISEYTSEWIEKLWMYRTPHLYPPVESIGAGEKENIILAVARCVPDKAPLWLMERFIEWDFEGWELHLVTATSIEAHDQYEKDVIRLAEQHPSIVMHRNISSRELHGLYKRAKILWGANGMRNQHVPQSAEHFGYTPVEAWSAGCVPVMFDRGGHKETVHNWLRWDTPEKLLEITRAAMDPDVFIDGRFAGVDPVDMYKYDPQEYAWQWEQYIRRVNALALELDKIDPISISAAPIRVAMVCDQPWLPEYGIGVTTGFGMVGGQVARRFIKEKDIHLSVMGLYDTRMWKTSQTLPFDMYPPIADPEGLRALLGFISWANPEVLFFIRDPGSLVMYLETYMNKLNLRVATVAYFPIEGSYRVNPGAIDLVNLVDFPVTYCYNGLNLIRKHVPGKEIHVAYHGIDHGEFTPIPGKDRERLREIIDWQDKFIVMTCATNKRVKNFPILLDAMRILLERGHDDIYMYWHTKMFDQHVLQGWHLKAMIEMESNESGLDIGKHIYKPADYDKWHGVDYKGEVGDWRFTRPSTLKGRGVLFQGLSLIQRYCMADLYVDVSSAEGFGLPVLEAASCGVPAVTVDDKMARSEIHSRYCHMLQPSYWDTWHTGTRLAMVTPEAVADKIIELKENSDLRNKFMEKQLKIMDELPWEPSLDLFVDLTKRAYSISRGA